MSEELVEGGALVSYLPRNPAASHNILERGRCNSNAWSAEYPGTQPGYTAEIVSCTLRV